MSKRDNFATTLMINLTVNLQCDDEKLELRYRLNPDNPKFSVWFCNGENTGLQCIALIEKLKEKYKSIKVLYKRAV